MNPAGAAFFDRDGILNELVYYTDWGEMESPREPAALRVREGVAEALRELTDAGWRLFLVSNQPSYAKGKTSLQNLKAVHARLEEHLAQHQIHFAEALYCYHHPAGVVAGVSGECSCRKPKPGLLLEAASKHNLSLGACWMVGDQDSDVECGRAAGARTILVPNEHSAAKCGRSSPNVIAPDLRAAVRVILQHEESTAS